MLHGWTEFDAVSLERQMFNATLDANGTRPKIAASVPVDRARSIVATALVALAARLAPATAIEQPRYSTAAHA